MPEVLEHYQERFRYILVDEYQDTNRAQYQLVNQLAAKYRNVCVVGDADQGVYSWRGATIQNLLDFERDYPDAQVFLMEQNYRSTSSILAVANALIEHNLQRKPKSLWTETEGGELAVRFRADNEHEEALFVAEETHRLVEEEGHRFTDVAIFYRTNAQSPCPRGRVRALGDAVQGDRRRPVLPAQGDQGRPRVPAAAREPAGRDQRAPRDQHARSAGSATRPSPRSRGSR